MEYLAEIHERSPEKIYAPLALAYTFIHIRALSAAKREAGYGFSIPNFSSRYWRVL
jgi:hypothetical protein